MKGRLALFALALALGCGTKVLEPEVLPPPLPPCPPGVGPIDGKCTRCAVVDMAKGGPVSTCLVCKPDLPDPSGRQCRNCNWTGFSFALACSQCPGDAGPRGPDECDALLGKLRATMP
jgi:hypothetical protein